MKLYRHIGNGHCLGSVVIAWAGSMKTAKRLIRDALDANGLSEEPLNVTCEGGLKNKPEILYLDHGDY